MWRASHGGPRTQSRTTDANLNFVFVKIAHDFMDAKKAKKGWGQIKQAFVRFQKTQGQLKKKLKAHFGQKNLNLLEVVSNFKR